MSVRVYSNKGRERFCKHCLLRLACRPRKLCKGCYYSPEIRVCYPIESTTKDVKIDDGVIIGPSHYPPGSEGKIGVMGERASRRQELFHPQDNYQVCSLCPNNR